MGLCPPGPLSAIPLPKGRYQGSFDWDGVNWGGPSDTGEPKGPAFPPGKHTLSVSTAGEAAGSCFTVSASMQLTLQ